MSVAFEFPDPEVTKARHLMSYGVAEFRQDWEEAVALSVLMSMGPNERKLAPLLKACMDRILAYRLNHPDSLPFEVSE